ncbi:MAG: TM2 domain-containing protein [Flavobacteriales bacterium]|nr:TM2 domain-containing protein [Flavobacteriales bacterium]
MRSIILCLLLALGSNTTIAAQQQTGAQEPTMWDMKIDDPLDSTHSEPERLVAGVLALTLGPFGAHRLYLGTVPKVPIIYGITFGGFGVLALLDLGHILFTRDLAPYRQNDRVFMWGKPQPEPTPP